jgi:hypothetical protein
VTPFRAKTNPKPRKRTRSRLVSPCATASSTTSCRKSGETSTVACRTSDKAISWKIAPP